MVYVVIAILLLSNVVLLIPYVREFLRYLRRPMRQTRLTRNQEAILDMLWGEDYGD
jgi:hypothetical protein